MNSVPRYRIVTTPSPPFVTYDNSTNVWSGYCIDVINELRKITYFDYNVQASPDTKLGEIDDETGNWNGAIKELIDDNADIAVGPLWATVAREKVIDFTEPIFEQNGFSILMQKDQRQWPFLRFLQLLDYEVWASFATAFIVTSLLLFFFERHSPFSYRNFPVKYESEPDDRFCSLKGCFWYVTTCVTPEGGGETPKSLSSKLAAATWWLFGFIIVATYTANLAGHQTLLRLEKEIDSLDDLRNQYQVGYTMIENSSVERYFRGMKDTEAVFHRLWAAMSVDESKPDWERAKLTIWEYPFNEKYSKTYYTMLKTGFPKNLDQALRMIRASNQSRGFALLSEAVTIKYLVMTNCDLKEVGAQFAKKPFAIALQQGSPLREKLNMALRIMKRQGKFEMLHRKWWDENPERADCSPDVHFNAGLGLDNLGAAFVVIGVGTLIALAILIIQYWWYCHHIRKSTQVSSSSVNVRPD